MIFGRAPEKAQQFAQKPCAPERSQSLDQEPCYFLTLSREIRDMIYGYILVNEHTIEPYTPFPEDKRKPLEPKIASLLRTNKLISAEARQMLYGMFFAINSFHYRVFSLHNIPVLQQIPPPKMVILTLSSHHR